MPTHQDESFLNPAELHFASTVWRCHDLAVHQTSEGLTKPKEEEFSISMERI